MGSLILGKCSQCGHEFEYSTIGGFNFAIVRCTLCDNAKSISWDEHSEKKEHGRCKCGGLFTNDALVRCPNCYSDKIKELEIKLMFD